MSPALEYDIAIKADLNDQISSFLIGGSEKNSLEQDHFWLNGDSVALIVAGRQVLLTNSSRS